MFWEIFFAVLLAGLCLIGFCIFLAYKVFHIDVGWYRLSRVAAWQERDYVSRDYEKTMKEIPERIKRGDLSI